MIKISLIIFMIIFNIINIGISFSKEKDIPINNFCNYKRLPIYLKEIIAKIPRRYNSNTRFSDIDFNDYLMSLSGREFNNFEDCEFSLLKTKYFNKLSKNTKDDIISTYKTAESNTVPNGNQEISNLVFFTTCQPRACTGTFVGHIFSREGELIGILIMTPSSLSNEPSKDQKKNTIPSDPVEGWSSLIKNPNSEFIWDVEGWISINKNFNNKSNLDFIKEYVSKIQKDSSFSMINLHNISD
ncbi:hypothetical protein D5366_06500 [Neokomagataea tanensis]|uniref:Uncharacterized protein n=2 Tax=Neokomagataea TaxID=1223423 RepID=A0A4Y6V7R6_9PROT|nr:hypothetical protein [Neokomagataea tanensis]QDH24918.1 hypothetical protein D5366_06500 [Neokomagataea tanensis]